MRALASTKTNEVRRIRARDNLTGTIQRIARAPRGQADAAAKPPSRVMNSRRLMPKSFPSEAHNSERGNFLLASRINLRSLQGPDACAGAARLPADRA